MTTQSPQTQQPTIGLPSRGRADPIGIRVGAALPVRQRRPGYAALAVVLIVGLGALGAYLYGQAGRKVPVVVVIRDVPAGHVIERSDLSTVDVAGDITAIGGASLQSAVGQSTTVELLPNTLLQRSMLSAAPGLDATSAQVGVAVSPGQIPADGLRAGDTVEILELAAKANAIDEATPAAPTTLVAHATVFSSADNPAQSGGTLLTVVVPSSAAAAVAAASSAGLIALIRVGR